MALGYAKAQNIEQARFTISDDGETFRFIELTLDNGVRIGISDCAEISYLENDYHHDVHDSKQPNLDLPIKYYENSDIHDPHGKLKSIGDIVFKYNNVFDIHDKFGTLKSVGNIPIKYYNTFDIHDPKGKVKSVGEVQISYFNTFDIKERFGDLKSIKGNSSTIAVIAPYRRRLHTTDEF